MDRERKIGEELKVLNNLIRKYFETHNRLKDHQLSHANCWIIDFVYRNGDKAVFQRDFEKEFHVSRSTASKVVNLMEKKGFIKKVPMDSDARLKKLTLCEPSFEVLKLMEEDAERMESCLVEGFTPEELEQMRGYLKRMQRNVYEKT